LGKRAWQGLREGSGWPGEIRIGGEGGEKGVCGVFDKGWLGSVWDVRALTRGPQKLVGDSGEVKPTRAMA